MAVYTKFDKENIEEILSNYTIGKLNSFKGIQEELNQVMKFIERWLTASSQYSKTPLVLFSLLESFSW